MRNLSFQGIASEFTFIVNYWYLIGIFYLFIKAIEREKSCTKDKIEPTENISIAEHLRQIFAVTISTSFPELDNAPAIITVSTQLKFGDYQCNSAMALSQLLKQKGQTLSPRDIATRILNAVEPSTVVSKLEIAGPGFINIFLNK